ncbi:MULTISPECIES: hypothetical protein [unclassified Leucobacter]|uniref:hypothetical protein n=1 Tax=unclassified Leucobacter TaxID=2621730 RepID=UPI001BFD0A43|nr:MULTISPECIES: hypothetical protein [unclassified Leucobacter]
MKTVRRGKLNQFGFVGAVGSNWGKKLGVLPGSDGIGWTGNQQYFNIEAVSDPKTVTIQGPVSTSLSQKPEIFGRGTIRATIQVWNSTTGVLLGTTTVRDDGYWFLDAGTVFQSGQTVEITAKQVARYSVKASEAHATFTVSQPVTIRLRSISTQKQQAVVFGTATPNAKVHVRADSTGEEAFILADAQGKWRDHTFTGLPSGKTTFTVVQYIDTVRPVQGGSASIGFSIEVPAVAEKPVSPVAPEKPVEPVSPVAPEKPVEPVTHVAPEKPVDPVDPVVPGSSVVETFDHDPGDITTETSEEDESSVEAVTDDAVEQLPLGPSAKAVEEARLEEARLAALAELEEKRLAAAREAEAKLAAEQRELEQKQRELEKLQRELAEKKPETEPDQPAESETKQDVEIGSHAATQPEPDDSPETEDSKAATGVTADVSAEADRLEEAKRVLEAEKRALEERAAAEAAQQEAGEQPHDTAQTVAEVDVVAETVLVAETLPAAEPVPAEPVPAQVPANDVVEAVPGVDKPVYSPDNTTLPAVGRVELTAPLEQAGERVTINVQPAEVQNVAPAPQPVTTLVRAQAEAAPVAAPHTRETARSVALPVAASAPTAPKPAAVPMKSVVADKSAAIASVRESESVNLGGIYVLGFGVLAAAGAAACSREVLRRRNTAVNQENVSAA